MADYEKQVEDDNVIMNGVEGEEKRDDEREKLMEGMVSLDFDMLCSSVALQTQGKWSKLPKDEDVESGDFGGGVLRMWEGEVLDCFDDQRIALESAFCPCYRFGKNMGRAGFGSCLLQGITYMILATMALLNCIAFGVTRRHFFLYLALAFIFLIPIYMGFFRTQIKRKFSIMGSESAVDDCVYHLICPWCTLCQESRTLEMNMVEKGVWHGRGDSLRCMGRGEQQREPPVIPNPSDMNFNSGNPAKSQNIDVR